MIQGCFKATNISNHITLFLPAGSGSSWKMSYADPKLLTWSLPHLLQMLLTYLWLLAPPPGTATPL